MAALIQDSYLLNSIAITLLHFLWQGLVVAAILKILLTVIPKTHANLRYGLACFAMVSNAILVLVTYSIVYQQTVVEPFAIDQNQTNISSINSSLATGFWSNQVVDYLPYLTIAWLITVMVLASKLLIELVSVNRLPYRQSIAPPQAIEQKFEQLCQLVGVSAKTKLLVSLQSHVPMAIGWLKPVVLIPATMISGLTGQQLQMLLLHELAHIKRHDYLVNIVQSVVEVFLFFHPAISWIGKQIRNEREYCSDDIAVHHCGSAIGYAHALTDTASLCLHKHKATVPNLAIAASGGDLTSRVLRLVHQNHHCVSSNQQPKFIAAAVVLLSISLLSVNLLTSKQLEKINQLDLNASSLSFIYSTLARNNATEHVAHANTSDDHTYNLKADIDTENRVSLAQRLVNPALHTEHSNQSLSELKEQTIDPIFAETYISFANEPANRYAGAQNINSEQNETAELTSLNANDSELTDKPLTHTARVSRAQLVDNNTASKQPSKIEQVLSQPSTNTSLAASLMAQQTDIGQQLSNAEQLNRNQQGLNSPLPHAGRYQHLIAQSVNNNAYKYKVSELQPQVPAKLISSSAPKYPSTAKRNGVELDVLVSFTIDKTGRVKDLQFEQKHRAYYFKKEIRSAMQKWRFQPAQLNGVAVESEMTKLFSFSLAS